jgi:lipoate synthase
MSEVSRFQLNAETGLPSMRDFAEFGKALRSMASDEESIKLSDGMGELSRAIETVGSALSTRQPGATIGPMLVDLLTAIRKHRQLVVGLGESWRMLYEYAAYLAALNNFRVLIGQWLVERNISGNNKVVIDDFEMIAWRTLGEGLLMIDLHEQARSEVQAESASAPMEESRLARAKQWWGQLRS